MGDGYGIIPKLIIKNKKLTIEAKAIYAYLCSYTGGGNTAFPSLELILEDLNITKRRYYRHFNLLLELGYIIVEKNRPKSGGFAHNNYILVTEVPGTHREETPNTLFKNI